MKIIAAISIFVIALVMGAIPLIFARSARLKSLLTYCDALTTGLFLGVGLIHLLPEAIEHVIEQQLPGSLTGIFTTCAATAIFLQAIEHTGKKIARHSNDHSSWISYFLIVILSIHSALEGIVLGVELSPKYEMTLFVAIMAHKGAAAFSVITNMLTNDISRYKAITALVFFSLATPLGILLGKNLLDTHWIEANHYIQPYFDAMAAGTFIYVAISHNPYRKAQHHAINISLSILGFLAMAFLSSYI